MHLTALVAYPNRERCAPVTVTRDTPVDNVFEEVTHTACADCWWNPVDGCIGCQKLVFYRCHLDKPRLARVVDKRCVATPAMWITVFKHQFAEKQTAVFEVSQNPFVCVLAEYVCQLATTGNKLAIFANKLNKWQIVVATNVSVVLTKGRSNVYNTCTVCQRYVVVVCYVVGIFLKCCPIVQWFVVNVLEVATFVCFQNCVGTFLKVLGK